MYRTIIGYCSTVVFVVHTCSTILIILVKNSNWLQELYYVRIKIDMLPAWGLKSSTYLAMFLKVSIFTYMPSFTRCLAMGARVDQNYPDQKGNTDGFNPDLTRILRNILQLADYTVTTI